MPARRQAPNDFGAIGSPSDGVLARLETTRFVLVGAQHPGNVGACARALANLGFRRLVLVAPECDPRDGGARRMAVDAAELLDTAEVHDDLETALTGVATVIGTSGRTGKHRRPHWRLDDLGSRFGRLLAGGELAVLFGREAHGLSDAELDRCTHLVRLPSAGSYRSFNLAQAVLLVAYELRLGALGPPEDAVGPAADHAAREAMYRHLETALRSIGFLQDQNAEVMMRRLRRMLGRAQLTTDDVQILRGIARQMMWAGRRDS